jgi:hypothetical protein
VGVLPGRFFFLFFRSREEEQEQEQEEETEETAEGKMPSIRKGGTPSPRARRRLTAPLPAV